jgi:tetratricopeptide (TPR) repeat protein
VRVAAVAAAIVLIGRAGAVPAARAAQPPAAPPPAGVLVMPFENVTHDSRIFWLGEASAVLLTDDLNALGMNAITRPQRREAVDRLQVPASASLTDATVIRIGQLVGAAQVVLGTLELSDGVLIVHAKQIVLETGRVAADVVERGPVPDLFATFERIARRCARGATAGAGELTHPPVAAFENYIKGLVAETPATEVKYLEAALSLDPKYDRARLALWDVFELNGDHERAIAAAVAVPSDSALYSRAQFLAAISELSLKRYDDAFATFKLLADARPTASALNNLGVVQLRRGATPETGSASSYFRKAAELDPGDPDYFFNLGYACWVEHDTEAAARWLREAVRRDPTDADAHFVLGAALAAGGNAPEAAREKELARRLSATYEAAARRPGADPVPSGLERVKGDVELPHRRLEAALVRGEQRDQQELARFYLDRGRRLYEQENDREALTELQHAIYLSPYLAEAHLLVGRIHLRNGRVNEAIDALKISIWSHESAPAHLALAEAYLENNDRDAARAEVQRALKLDPDSADARTLLARIGAG